MNSTHTKAPGDQDLTTPRLFRLKHLHAAKTEPVGAPVSGAQVSGTSGSTVSGKSLSESTAPATSPAYTQPGPAPSADHQTLSTHQTDAAGSESFSPDHVAHPGTSSSRLDAYQPTDFERVAFSLDPNADDNVAQNRTPETGEPQHSDKSGRYRHRADTPEGRSWMESAAAHRNVLILLAVAVAAAFWTSGDSDDPEAPGSSLATTEKRLQLGVEDFDIGTPVQSPSHHRGGKNLTETPASHTIAAADQRSQSDTVPSVPPGPATASGSLTPTTMNDPSSLANLSGQVVPQTDAYRPADPSSPQAKIAMAQASTADLDAGYSLGSPPVSAQVVSSTTPYFPSLQTPLIDELESTRQPSGSELQVRDSATPNGIDDWLRYLPPSP